MFSPWKMMPLSVLFALLTMGTHSEVHSQPAGPVSHLSFTDASHQTKQFIGYFHSIHLTPDQQRTKQRVLGAIPAPCCSNYSIATCCCPCNLAKSVWGLSNYAIARLGYDERQLRSAVLDWLAFVNPGGFSGDSCFTGRCEMPFARNGCGSMAENRLTVRAR